MGQHKLVPSASGMAMNALLGPRTGAAGSAPRLRPSGTISIEAMGTPVNAPHPVTQIPLGTFVGIDKALRQPDHVQEPPQASLCRGSVRPAQPGPPVWCGADDGTSRPWCPRSSTWIVISPPPFPELRPRCPPGRRRGSRGSLRYHPHGTALVLSSGARRLDAPLLEPSRPGSWSDNRPAAPGRWVTTRFVRLSWQGGRLPGVYTLTS